MVYGITPIIFFKVHKTSKNQNLKQKVKNLSTKEESLYYKSERGREIFLFLLTSKVWLFRQFMILCFGIEYIKVFLFWISNRKGEVND